MGFGDPQGHIKSVTVKQSEILLTPRHVINNDCLVTVPSSQIQYFTILIFSSVIVTLLISPTNSVERARSLLNVAFHTHNAFYTFYFMYREPTSYKIVVTTQ